MSKDEVETSFVDMAKEISGIRKLLSSSTYVNNTLSMIRVELQLGNHAEAAILGQQLRDFRAKEALEEREASGQLTGNNSGGMDEVEVVSVEPSVCPPTGLAEGRKKYALESDSEEDDDLLCLQQQPVFQRQPEPVVVRQSVVQEDVPRNPPPSAGPPGTFTQLGNEWRARLARASVIQEKPVVEQQPVVQAVVEKEPELHEVVSQLHKEVDKMNLTHSYAMTQESQLSLLTAGGESQDQIVWASQPVIPFGRMHQTDSRIN